MSHYSKSAKSLIFAQKFNLDQTLQWNLSEFRRQKLKQIFDFFINKDSNYIILNQNDDIDIIIFPSE